VSRRGTESSGADEADLTLREARARYFAANGLPADGGYHARWVRLSIGPLPFAFPTRPAAAACCRRTTSTTSSPATPPTSGEGEIAAFEIGAGVRDRSALQLELRVLGFALARWPGRIWRAFLRGRRCQNLLGAPCEDAAFLARSLAPVRRELGLDAPLAAPARADRLAFARWAGLAAAIVWGPLLPLAAFLWWWLG